MTSQSDDDRPETYASPPCFMHELDPGYMGLAEAGDPQQWADVMRWRTAERERLIRERLAIPSDVRRRQDKQIAANLEAAAADVAGQVVTAYWPIRGEPDLRRVVQYLVACGARMALPVVVGPGRPLIFRAWTPGAPLERGVWGLLTPPADAEVVVPDTIIVPVVGFDPACHRLGYGGGFFDRTLAVLANRPRVVGVGYSQAMIATIYPQPHDIPMNAIVTEDGFIKCTGGCPQLSAVRPHRG